MRNKKLPLFAAELSDGALDATWAQAAPERKIETTEVSSVPQTGNSGNDHQEFDSTKGLKAFPVEAQNREQTGNATGNKIEQQQGAADRGTELVAVTRSQPQVDDDDCVRLGAGGEANDDARSADDPVLASVEASLLAVPQLAVQYTLITSPATLETVIPEILAASAVGLDIETTGLDPRVDRIRLVQLAVPGRVYIADCFQVDPLALAPVFSGARRFVGHNLKFDLQFLAAAGLEVPNGDRLFDTMLASQLLYAGTEDGTLRRCGLAAVVARTLGMKLDKYLQGSDWSGPLTRGQLEYAARDAAVLLQLAERLEAELAVAGLEQVAQLEFRCLPAIVWLERTGAPFDARQWAGLSDLAVADEILAEKSLESGIGEDRKVNWNSPKQVLELLRSRGHQIASTDETTIRSLAEREPIAKFLLERRGAARRASTYGGEFIEKFLHPTTGRIHADYLQLGAESGRMACSKPNLQNIPRDPAYRACFRAPEGRVLVKADYSQIELRIAAELTGDERMIAAYARGEDLHALTAELVLGKTTDALRPEDRQAAKAVNFGLIYGMGATRFKEYAFTSYGVRLTESEAQSFRERFFRAYPGLRRWHRSQPDGMREIRTLSGRRRLAVERFTEKLNTPVQGTGADGVKMALALLWETRGECPSAAPVLCVHDEIVLECDEAEAERARDWLVTSMKRGMERFLKKVPVVVEARVGNHWGKEDKKVVNMSRQETRPGAVSALTGSDDNNSQPDRDGCDDQEIDMGLKFKASSRTPPLEAGVYGASLAKIEQRAGLDGSYLMWTFAILVNGENRKVTATSSTNTTPKAKPRQWTEAILGRLLEVDEEIDLEMLYGRRCRLVLTVAKIDDGGLVNRVEKVLQASATSPPPGDGTNPGDGEKLGQTETPW